MPAIDLTQELLPYENKWVAMDDKNKIIASGKTLDESETEVKKTNHKNYGFMFVDPFDRAFAGYFYL